MKHTARIRLLPAACVAALAAAGTGLAAGVFTAGHGDIGVAYEDGALEPHWHLHPGAVVDGAPLAADEEYAPDGLVAWVADPSIARPPGAQWDFLGTASGSPLWFLPQALDPLKPFLGIASEELDPADWNSLKLSLVQFSGPDGGQFSLWQADLFGNPEVKMTTADGISGVDAVSLVPGGHGHFNYGFTAPGVYELEFQWDADHKTDGPVSATATFAFGVTAVPEPGPAALLALGGAALLWRRRS